MNSHQLLLALLRVLAVVQIVLAEGQEGFISLDCGLSASEPPYTESETGLTFSSDVRFVEGGKSGRIQKHLEANFLKPYATLRYFPNGIQNCYDLNITQDTRYLVRAAFFYGNYDGLDRHPNFDLYIDRNWWETISSPSEKPAKKWTSLQSMERGYGTVEEIIHTPRSNTLQVCLVKKDATVPFISTLELRPFSTNVYATLNGSLKTFFRLYSSDSVHALRYPDDVHDRTWVPFDSASWAIIKNSTIKTVNTNPFDPPLAAVRTAAIPANASSPLVLSWVTSNPTEQLYVYIHFLELEVLRANDTRIFDIVANGNTITRAYSPTKSMIDTVYNTVPLNYNNDSEYRLELRKTSDSNLPPLFNAIEAFTVMVFYERETYEVDVIAMEKILAAYALSKGSGDPCLPIPSHYLKCSNYTDTSEPLRIISLNLSSNGLSGIISPTIENLTKLQVLDLSSNNLTGGVPEFLSHLNDLLFIDLSNNSLSGPVPKALLDREKERLVLNLHGNPELYEITSSKKNFPVAVVASVASIATVLAVFVFLFIGLRRKLSRREALRPSIETAKRRFTYSEIMAMTNNFQKILGEGGFGIIYHGHLNNSQQVAVKILSQSSSQGYKQFKAEVELLMRVHHINLVNLAGYCDERDHLALVYEYMANRDLKEHLSGKEGSSFLDWPCRLRIAAEAALGLEYLHSGCKPPMYHRDVKSTNILLNDDFQAKLGDFGLSRSFPVGSETHVSTVVVGTPGFLDPEYYQTNRLSEKSDVYSFGIVLLEIITNQLVIDQTRERPHIAEWVRFLLTTGDMESIMDPNLKGNYSSGSAWKVLELAMLCSRPSSAERPNMAQIVHELNECLIYENSRRRRRENVSSKSANEGNTSTEMAPMAR